MFGIGGGLVIVPSLIYTFKYQGADPSQIMHLAIGSSLATIVVTGISSAISHYQKGSLHFSYLKMLLPGLVFGATAGVILASNISGNYLSVVFGIFLVLIAAKIYWAKPMQVAQQPAPKSLMGIAGFAIGGISAIFGIGGGTLSVPWLHSRGCSLKQSIGTSSACSVVIAFFGAVTFAWVGRTQSNLPDWSTGFVVWPAVLCIGITSIPFSNLGTRLAHVMPDKLLKAALSTILALVGLKFILW